MTKSELATLHTILAKVETLQKRTTDEWAKERLGNAKNELMRILHH